jgi:hypothetical protein
MRPISIAWACVVYLRKREEMEIKHVCQSCGEVMAVHQHSDYQQVKDCLAGMRAVCDECASLPGVAPISKNQPIRPSIPINARS